MRTLAEEILSKENPPEGYYDLKNLLTNNNKKVVAFMGGSKCGTSFLINNIAQILSARGVDVAILDTTKNRNSYFIYTKNEDKLRKIALNCIDKLAKKEAKGIKVNKNLTVYTTVPGDDKYTQSNNPIQEAETILKTLLEQHTLVLLDCDFKTPINYFEYVTELYLIQVMEVLTIQPFTEVLLKIKNKGMLSEAKLKIILNKYIDVAGVTEKEIIGAMSYYNDPSMAYMKELFNKFYVPYMKIPFNEQVYETYLQAVANCDITLERYPREFIKLLEQLANEVYCGEGEKNS